MFDTTKQFPSLGDFHPTYEDYLKQVLGIYSDVELVKFLNSPSWGCLTMQSPDQSSQPADPSPEPQL